MSVQALSLRLQKELEEEIRAVNAEIRRYPGPIAHCDAQLAGLLDERSRLVRLAEALQEFEAIPA